MQSFKLYTEKKGKPVQILECCVTHSLSFIPPGRWTAIIWMFCRCGFWLLFKCCPLHSTSQYYKPQITNYPEKRKTCIFIRPFMTKINLNRAKNNLLCHFKLLFHMPHIEDGILRLWGQRKHYKNTFIYPLPWCQQLYFCFVCALITFQLITSVDHWEKHFKWFNSSLRKHETSKLGVTWCPMSHISPLVTAHKSKKRWATSKTSEQWKRNVHLLWIILDATRLHTVWCNTLCLLA